MKDIMKKSIIVLISILSFLFLTSCKKFVLQISGENIVEVGEEIKLSHNYEGKKRIEWKSSDPNIAYVYNGKVTGIAEGEVVITAKVEKYEATFTVTVIDNSLDFYIEGKTDLYVGDTAKYKIISTREIEGDVTWSVSDDSIGYINEYATFYATGEGRVTIYATAEGIIKEFVVVVKKLPEPRIVFNAPEELEIGEMQRITVGVNVPMGVNAGYVDFEVNPKGIVSLTGVPTGDWHVKGIGVGTVTIKVYFTKMPHIYVERTINIVEKQPINVVISGSEEMEVGAFNNLTAKVYPEEVSQEVMWSSSDETIAIVEDGMVLGLQPGNVTIYARSNVRPSVHGIFKITVVANEPKGYTEEELQKVEEIMSQMSLSQKIGQMFMIGFSGTSYTSTLDSVIKNYNFGNVIYMGANVANPATIAKMSNDLQSQMVASNLVPAFISIDQEGGRVVRLSNGGTHFISNMAMLATNDVNNTYLQGLAVGKELRNYGINANFAPVLDVNNNPANPVIGARSYGENPFLVARYGVGLINGLRDSKVMATSKHFPGHGNTSVDSHSGLPVITSSKEDLYKIELAPFIASIGEGIDAIMTTHIIFTAIDSTLPATLSEKVLTNLLRNELGYDGIIVTDGMEMGALQSNFGNSNELAIKAVKAGVDMLLYTSNTTPRGAHSAIMECVQNGEITEERINESVRRILLKKLKYNLLEDYTAPNSDISDLLENNEKLNNDFAISSLTQMKGTFDGLSKEEKILIISPKCNYTIDASLENNSLGCFASRYLRDNGYDCDYYTISENATSSERSAISGMLSTYDRIIIATSNVSTKNYTNTQNLVNQILRTKENTIVIALDTPYDYLGYMKLENYICVYGYQKASVIAITKYLNGEFKAQGVSPIDFK